MIELTLRLVKSEREKHLQIKKTYQLDSESESDDEKKETVPVKKVEKSKKYRC